VAHGGAGAIDAGAWIAALGGAANVTRLEALAGRVLVTVRDSAAVDGARLVALGARAIATPSKSSVHVLHEDPERLRARLAPA
jgi:PTS system N-acetylglucosamine-specific IIC component